MNLQKIEQLIVRYEEGNTSLEEESLLMEFFRQKKIPYHLKIYKDLFNYTDSSRREELPDEHFEDRIITAIHQMNRSRVEKMKKIRMYSILTAAASVVLLIGFYFWFGYQMSSVEDTYDDPLMAYAETKKILLKVSGNLNEGVDELKIISEFNRGINELQKISTFDNGMQYLEKIAILEQSKEIITIKSK